MTIWHQTQLDVLMCMARIQWIRLHPVMASKVLSAPVI